MLIHLLLLLWWIAVAAAAGIDWRRHGRGGSALVRMLRRAKIGIAGIGILI